MAEKITTIFDHYSNFVDGVTSEASKNNNKFIERIQELEADGVDVARLTTAALGLGGESGEVIDLIKKILFHGKPFTEENRNKLVDEAGDILWYWMNLCIALGADGEVVLLDNIKKLETRYPGGKFSIERSEDRIV